MYFFWLVVPQRVISMEFLQSFLRLLASRNVGCYLRLGKLLSNKFHFNRRTLLYISLSSHTRQTPLYSRYLCFSSAVINIVDFSLTALSLGLHVVFNDFLWNQKSSQCKKVNINFETCGTSCPAHTTSRYWVISSHDTSIEWNCHRRVTIFYLTKRSHCFISNHMFLVRNFLPYCSLKTQIESP